MPLPRFAPGQAALGALALLLCPGPSLASTPATSHGTPALYASQAEAEQAAKQHFHCTGAHRMGDQWMPCSSHNPQPANHHHH